MSNCPSTLEIARVVVVVGVVVVVVVIVVVDDTRSNAASAFFARSYKCGFSRECSCR